MKRPAAVLLLALAVRAAAQPAATVESRLAALEARVQALAAENTALRLALAAGPKSPVAPAPTAAATPPPLTITPSGHEAKFVIGGFVQAQADFGGAPDPRWAGVRDRIYFRRTRITVSGAFAENFDFKIDADFSANSLGAATGLRAQANEISLGWTKYPAATLRIGYPKAAFSAEILASDTKTLTIERSLGSDRLVDGRQPGVSVAGDFLGKRLGYLLVVANGNSGASALNDDSRFARSLRAYAVPLATTGGAWPTTLTLGASLLASHDTSASRSGFGLTTTPPAVDNLFAGRRRLTGLDARLDSGPVSLEAEWIGGLFEPANLIPSRRLEADAWHASAAWMFVPAKFQAVISRSHFDPNRDRAADATETWLAGLTWFLRGDDLKLGLNYIFRDSSSAHSANDHGRLITRMQVVY